MKKSSLIDRQKGVPNINEVEEIKNEVKLHKYFDATKGSMSKNLILCKSSMKIYKRSIRSPKSLLRHHSYKTGKFNYYSVTSFQSLGATIHKMYRKRGSDVIMHPCG